MPVEVWSRDTSKIVWLPLPPIGRRAEELMRDYACAIDTQRTVSTAGKRHQHPCMEIIVVHDGALALSIGREVQVLTAGDAVIFRGNVLHGGRTVGGSYTRTAFHLTEKLVRAASAYLQTDAADSDCIFASLPNERQSEFFQTLTRFCALKAQKELDDSGRALLFEALRHLHAESVPQHATLHPILRESLQLMAQPGTTSKVSDLARRLHTSESYLYALYQRELQCSPHQMWLQIRIEQACNQILQDNVLVGELADMLGFDHRRCFERAFRRVTAMCVSQYRAEGFDPIF